MLSSSGAIKTDLDRQYLCRLLSKHFVCDLASNIFYEYLQVPIISLIARDRAKRSYLGNVGRDA